MNKNYQKAITLCDEFQEFQILEYIKGKSPKIQLKCTRCGFIFERYLHHFIEYPHVCPQCHPKGSNQFITQEEAQQRVDQSYGENMLQLLNYKGNNAKVQVKCLKCGEIFESVPTSLWRHRIKGCPSCNKTQSLGESRIERLLRVNNIQYRTQERFNDCRDKLALPFDFYLPQLNICIEFQGEQHYKQTSLLQSEELVKHDKIKRDYCQLKGIQLIEIPYYDIDNLEKYFMFIRE